MEEEKWLPVVGHEGLYEVSDFGRVRSLGWLSRGKNGSFRPRPGRTLKPLAKHHGYLGVLLKSPSGKYVNRFVHRLVADAFLGGIPSGMQVNHKDLNKLRNLPSNLEVCTGKINVRHAVGCGKRVLTLDDALAIRTMCESGAFQREAADAYGVSRPHVSAIVNHKVWT